LQRWGELNEIAYQSYGLKLTPALISGPNKDFETPSNLLLQEDYLSILFYSASAGTEAGPTMQAQVLAHH
jgi:hypothetical protein